MKRALKELLFLFGFIVDSVFDALPPLRKRKKYQKIGQQCREMYYGDSKRI